MIDDKIKLSVQALIKARDELNELKKDKKNLEKDIPERLQELKKSKKELSAQVKELQDEHERQLNDDATYQKLREMLVQKEEDIAESKVKLWQLIAQIPQERNISLDITLDDNRFIKLQTEKDIRVYLNGREEKKA